MWKLSLALKDWEFGTAIFLEKTTNMLFSKFRKLNPNKKSKANQRCDQ